MSESIYSDITVQGSDEGNEWIGREDEPLTGFSWRGGIERDTTGILMWSKPFITTLPSTGEEVSLGRGGRRVGRVWRGVWGGGGGPNFLFPCTLRGNEPRYEVDIAVFVLPSCEPQGREQMVLPGPCLVLFRSRNE